MKQGTTLRFGKPFIFGILFIIGLLLPFVTESSLLIHLLIVTYFWAIMVAGYNLLMGYTGQLSLGHAAFYAIGAYTSAILAKSLGVPWPLGMLSAALFTGVISVLTGVLVLRLRGAYFAMVTLGLGEVTRLIIEEWEGLTGGVYGILRVPPLFNSIKSTYCFAFLLMLLVYFVIYRIIHSYIGRALISIREDEDVASSVGVNVARYKLLAFVISAVLCGITGSASAHYFAYVYPVLAHFLQSAALLVYTVVGGGGYLLGPAIASSFFTFLPEFSRAIGEYELLIYGLILVMVLIFIPEGVEPTLNSLFTWVKAVFLKPTVGEQR